MMSLKPNNEYKSWIIWLIFLTILLIFSSCKTTKDFAKKKENTTEQKNVTTKISKLTETKREGGQISTDIIPENQRLKDENGQIKELVQELKKGGLTKTIIYKPDGKVNVECTADEIWTRIQEKIQEQDNSIINTETKEKQKFKQVEFDSKIVLFIVLGFVLVAFIFFYFLFKSINKNSQILTELVTKI